MNKKNLTIASFGLDIVHAAWMKVHATISRVAEDDGDLYELISAVDDSLNLLARAVRDRLRA